ncbi:terminase [Microbacterium maritypicum]|uniref:terminase n=1 Tax=Microbacterium maritypicum TaxID=33918 RepID=UPI003A92E041
MAQLLSATPAFIKNRSDEAEEIKRWYRSELADTLPPIGLEWEPVKVGPTWQYEGGWLLPERSLGWEALAFAGQWLTHRGKPWKYTMEQARFVLWFHALNEDGTHVSHSAVLQRLKGWGKDPFAAVESTNTLVGPLEFDHWGKDGQPVGHQVTDAWVQIAAVSLDQTKNTMKIFPGLIPAETRRHFGIQIGKQNVWARGDSAQIEAVTASPLAIEGGRPKLVIRAETQNWNSSNGGHDMAGAMEGNAAKSEVGAPARILDICNAYRPGEDSVGQRQREAWDDTQGDDAKAMDYGLLYDSLEAPPEAPLTADAAPSVVEAVRGDSVWLDAGGRIRKSILNPLNSPSESRRKWYNQVTAAEDAWTEPNEFDPLKDEEIVVEPGEEIAMFLDCSKSDDATGLVGVRMSDGHVFTLGMWQKPPGKRGEGWLAPREEVDGVVDHTFEKYRVVAFFGDPSHTLNDETLDSYWDLLFDEWHRRYRNKLKVWAYGTKGGKGHAVKFDMTDRTNSKAIAEAVSFTLREIQDGQFTHDGDPRLRRHVLNARRYPVAGFVSIAKDRADSKNKIDLAVCMVGARMARRRVLNSGKKQGGRVW